MKLLNNFSIPSPVSKIVTDLDSAIAAIQEITFPVVIKASTEDIMHKTDLKAIYTNISSELELKKKLTALQKSIYDETGREHPPVLIQKQIEDAREELFIGVTRDGGPDVYEPSGKGFGHLLIFGKGGIYTEVYRDFSEKIIPVQKSDIRELINSTKISKIIKGTRGQSALHYDGIIEVILKLQRMILVHPEIKQLDINPLMLGDDFASVVDMKVIVG
jgi:acyl-CoA synthetase (NDP forming)